MGEWRPDIDIDEALAVALVESQFPELDVRQRGMTHLASGWDKSVWRVGSGELAFAFVHREVAIPIIEQEQRLLPLLADRLPLPVPRVRHVGATTASHAFPWFGFDLLPGQEIVEAPPAEAARIELGATLGTFLRVLHDPATLAAVDPGGSLPFDANRRAAPDLGERALGALDRFRTAGFELTDEEFGTARQVLDDVASLRPDGDPVFVHGDLHVRHLLVDERGAATGVIDWGDACRAPAGLDLTLYWTELDAAARAAFRSSYGSIGEDHYRLGRACAIYLAAIIAVSARDLGDHSRARGAAGSLRRALA
jgi:aminoglycoside phosphotransferase (APT) family kinase protein